MDLPENYRGITLFSTLGKLFTKILNSRLTDWAENYGVYVEAQAGFRSKMGTIDNIFVLHGLITHISVTFNVYHREDTRQVSFGDNTTNLQQS